MSAQANIVAFDGATTPVSHTFVPSGVLRDPKNGVTADYEEIISTVPTYARPRITMNQRKLANGVYRNVVSVAVPVMESVAGQNAAGYTAAPKVAYVNTASFISYNSERSTPAERKLVRQLLVNAIGGIVTSVAPVTTGNIAELFDSNIVPN